MVMRIQRKLSHTVSENENWYRYYKNMTIAHKSETGTTVSSKNPTMLQLHARNKFHSSEESIQSTRYY